MEEKERVEIFSYCIENDIPYLELEGGGVAIDINDIKNIEEFKELFSK